MLVFPSTDFPVYYHYTSLNKLERILKAGLLSPVKDAQKSDFLKKSVHCTTLAPNDHTRSEIVFNNWNRPLNEEKENGLQVCISFLEKGTSEIQPSSKTGRDLYKFSGGAKKLYQRIQCIFVDPDIEIKGSLRKLLKKIIDEHFIDVQPLEFADSSEDDITEVPSDDSSGTFDEPLPEAPTKKLSGLWNWVVGFFRSQPKTTEEVVEAE